MKWHRGAATCQRARGCGSAFSVCRSFTTKLPVSHTGCGGITVGRATGRRSPLRTDQGGDAWARRVRVHSPTSRIGNPVDLATGWSTDEAGTLSFQGDVERRTIGGRLSPSEDDVDLEFWMDNRNKGTHGFSLCFPLCQRITIEVPNPSQNSHFLLA